MTRHHRNRRPFRDEFSRKAERESGEMFNSPNPKRFYKSRTEKVWLGVCGGIANRFGWDATLVRILAVMLVLTGAAASFVVIGYIVMAMITKKEPLGRTNLAPEEEQFWRNVSDRPRVTASGLKYTFMDLEERLQNMERRVTSDEWRLKKAFRDLESN